MLAVFCCFSLWIGFFCGIPKEITWANFTWTNFKCYLFFSIITIGGLSILYIVKDLICKRRAKPLKEIYESYYWLVAHVDPYREGLCAIIKRPKPGIRIIHPKPPKCLCTALKELGYSNSILENLSLDPSKGVTGFLVNRRKSSNRPWLEGEGAD